VNSHLTLALVENFLKYSSVCPFSQAIDTRFQETVKGLCESCKGSFQLAPIKGYQRMMDKCLSRTDHFYEKFPRPGRNLDINRNCCTFESAEVLLEFAQKMCRLPQMGNQPIRIKNMFLFDDVKAEEGLHYRTVMINWLYTPGITYTEMAEESTPLWEHYYNFTSGTAQGSKPPSIVWTEWREHIALAMTFLKSVKRRRPVQFIVETQLLLRPYLEGSIACCFPSM
jgi:hypothetical protein